jgi:hypothetical protein
MSTYFFIGILVMMTIDLAVVYRGLPIIGFWGRFFMILLWPIPLFIFLNALFNSDE